MRVYKFLPADIARKVIAERRLKISTFQDSNDPYELSGLKLVADPKLDPFLIQFFKANLPGVLSKLTGMLCFTEGWNNPVLWAHYADRHKGIALGLEISTVAAELRRTRYVREKEERDITALLKAMASAALNQQKMLATDQLMKDTLPLFQEILSTKFADWEYEREIRTFAALNEKDGEHYFFGFADHTRLVEVIVGVRCPVGIPDILRDLSEYKDPIKVTKAMASEDTFEILEDAAKTVFHRPS